MKKMICLILGLIGLTSVLAAEFPMDLPDGFKGAEIQLTPTLKLLPEVIRKEDPVLHTKIAVHYPQMVGKQLDASAEQFNQTIKSIVDKQIQEFNKNVAEAPKNSPVSANDNTLTMDYDVDLLKPKNDTLISIRLFIESMTAGMAHPAHSHEAINYDLGRGKVIALSELFKPKTNYLQHIAAYSAPILDRNLKKKKMPTTLIASGTQPTAQHYQDWNLQADGLLITFEEGQVAPRYNGLEEITIPYSELKDVLAENAPIISCVKNAKECEVN